MNVFIEKNRGSIILTLLLIISFLLMVFTSESVDLTPKTVLGIVVYPFISLYNSGIENITDFFTSVKQMRELKNENAALQEEIHRLKELRSNYEFLKKENNEYRQLLNFKDEIEYNTEIAEIIGKDPTNLYSFLIINKGISNGIKIGMPVYTVVEGEKIVIGKIYETSYNYSKVITIFDSRSYIPIKESISDYSGIARGNAPSNFNLKVLYFSNDYDIEFGDKFITSGMGGIYPPGLIVGNVKNVKKGNFELYQEITLKPAIKLDNIDYLYVIKKENLLWEE